MTTYRDALRYMYGFTDYEKRGFAAYAPEFYDLERVERLLALLGDPHRSFRAVHIAGTKGKGSTSAMIESVLRVAGYRSGLYTSPHLHTFRERIQACGEMIPEADIVRLVDKMRPLAAQVDDVTTFEVMTCLAFAWFEEQAVEWAVVEVGLGGRLDATNVLIPAVSVITSLSYDHTAVLGDTLALIAAEKAGIVKRGVPVVSAPQPGEALAVIEAISSEMGAPLTLVGRDWIWEAGAVSLEGQQFSIRHRQDEIRDLCTPLLGEHQLINATAAVATLSLLREAGLEIPQPTIREGMKTVSWPGRFEILGRQPLVIADSAHNGDSARKLVATVRAVCDYRRLIVILGASADHATPELMEALLVEADRAIAAQAKHPRAADPDWLQDRAAALGLQLEVSGTVAQALELALADVGPEDLVLCTGSVFVAGDARLAWFARTNRALPPSDPV
jgi:dihydrofolate synthase/folylpolyglutamate synthase